VERGWNVKFFDVTRALFKDELVYPGDCHPSFIQEDRGNYLISDLHLSSHSGTHIDAPVHYLKKGPTIDKVPLDNLIGKCRVIDLHKTGPVITAGDLEGQIEGIERLLIKTSFSGTDKFVEDYPCLDRTAANKISDNKIRCIGIDSPSIESYNCTGEVHRILLATGCVIIELLDLSGVDEGEYEMIALPLRMTGVDGSPARVVLREIAGDS
jgi:arylformamidase